MSELLSSLNSVEELLARVPDTEQRLSGLYDYLMASEKLLLAMIEDVNAGVQPRPVAPDQEGDLEFGLFLYWLKNLDEKTDAQLNLSGPNALALSAVRTFAPPSLLSANIYTAFVNRVSATGVVAADGTLYALSWYAQLDPLWLTTLPNYAINLIDPKSIYHPYPAPSASYKATINTAQSSISIAIVGDWGTGPYGHDFGGHGPAIAVMNAMKSVSPDYAVHLGDVYYSGTDMRLPMHEEKNNLLTPWDTGLSDSGRNFTINSNHEMYGGGQGLMGVALGSGTPFSHQNNSPYFALDYGKWVIIGLDSAYFDTSMLYMQGALGDANNTQQKDFVKSLGDLSQKKVLVMTHHNPMSYDGNSIVPNKQAGQGIWDAMVHLLGKQPDLWYWGHLHLGVAYNAKSILGAKGTVCRCVGHGAIPYGNAYGIDTANVDYYAHTPLAEDSNQVQNGFAVLKLDADGGFSEVFYEVTNNGDRVVGWQSPT